MWEQSIEMLPNGFGVHEGYDEYDPFTTNVNGKREILDAGMACITATFGQVNIMKGLRILLQLFWHISVE